MARSFLSRAAPTVRCLITSVILIFLSLSVGTLIVWLILHPQPPNFHVTSFSISNFTLSDNIAVRANYKIDFVVKNPNWKINLWVYHSNVSVKYKRIEVSRGWFQRFPLPKRGRAEKSIRLEMDANNMRRDGAAEMGLEYLSRKEVGYDVEVYGWATLRAGKWISEGRMLKVECKNLKVVFSGKFDMAVGELRNGSGGAACSTVFI
ncbi:hypothetical protein Sango_0493100 [Sesamum angolense]|uniref:Late embryogenesis abundant protein LEA-2 subgroup domain-containing protein n=1 Tax=Sesamum angolense TaxID=2727404 RepID=A0AAE1XBY9_9LAMI|nr:hypothetical protein Sango_0493100 [Sesamum angolense]